MGAEKRKILTFICLVMFLDAVGFGLILPVLPELIDELSDLSNSEAARIAGFLLFTFAGVQFFCAPILGGLSDKFGRRPVLLLALLGFALDYFVMAAAQSLLWLFIARMISGLFGATFTAANASIVDISTTEERAKLFGYTGAAVGLGFVFGPALGGLLGEYGTRLPFIVAGILTLATLAYGYVVFPETLSEETRRPFSWARANPLGSLISISRYPVVLMIIGAIFFMQLANQSFASIWSFYTIEVTSWSTFQIGLSITFYGMMLAIVQGGLTGPAVKKLGEVKATIFSLSVGFITFLGLAFAATGWQIYLWIFIGGFSAFAFPAMQALMTKRIPENAQGELQGALASSYSLTAIIGPIMMSQIFGAYTSGDGLYMPGAAFVAGAVMILLCLATFLGSMRLAKREATL
jgi:DHA1 family tetracycline resistance protein-like MFS transporter